MKRIETQGRRAAEAESSLLRLLLRAPAALRFVFFLSAAVCPAAEWQVARPGWAYAFPRDHRPHPEFKTEWWYFTGNLRTAEGRRFGYQLTFFRQGLRPPGTRDSAQSRFVVDDLKFAHFTVTDVATGRFRFQQEIHRGAFGEAGFNQPQPDGSTRLAWNGPWQLVLRDAEHFQLTASGASLALTLQLAAAKPWAIHGTGGVSEKAVGDGHASHYYSGTRLGSRGVLRIDGREFQVEGDTWFDHEWATNQLTAAQVGWDWFSIQLDDGTELMLYRMRLRDGGLDPTSSGSFISRDGQVQPLARADYTLQPLRTWKSPATGAAYPLAWELRIPRLDLRMKITTPVENQELTLDPIAYWEGVIDAEGTRAGQPVRGHGYLELTGYAGALVGLSAAPPGK